MEQNLNKILYNCIEEFIYVNGTISLRTTFGIFNFLISNYSLPNTQYVIQDFTDEVKLFLYNLCMNTEFPDIELPCYDPEDNNIYKGMMSVSNCINFNYKFTSQFCNYNVAKYNEEKDIWEEVYIVIKENGSFNLLPKAYCDLCVLFLTKDEWDNFKHPEELDEYQRWDFKREEWYDIRSLDDLYQIYKNTIYSNYNELLQQVKIFYLDSNNINIIEYSDNTKYKIIKSNNVKNLFDIDKIDKTEFLQEKELYINHYIEAVDYLINEMEDWLLLPKTKQKKFDLSKKEEWTNLGGFFISWFNQIYNKF